MPCVLHGCIPLDIFIYSLRFVCCAGEQEHYVGYLKLRVYMPCVSHGCVPLDI